MITTIYLIRHGQTDANLKRFFQGRTNLPLNQTGVNQVLNTARQLSLNNYHWDVVYASPLRRALLSAKLINDQLQKPLFQDQRLIERDFGACEGLPITDEHYQKLINNGFVGQETEEMIIKRAQDFLKMVLTKHRGQKVLLVCHSHLLKAILIPYNPSLSFDSSIINASLSTICFDDDQFIEMSINQKI